MIAGDDYKRASRLVEAADAAKQPDSGVPACALRLSWALSRIAAVPTPDLAEQLACALLELCGPERAVAVQLGRFDEFGRWRGESFGAAGRLPGDAVLELDAIKGLPWPRPPAFADTPACLVSQPPPGEPSMRMVEEAMDYANLGVELAALACSCERGQIVLTVQLGGPRDVHTRARAAFLAQVLPWAHAIARKALGEGPGLEPRGWLTEKEHVVLGQLVRGASVVEIAKTLDRSRYTVHDHVKSLHRKLGVRTRAALVGCATLGVPPPEVLK
ncbi:MAG: helix-turn-helix transcriptional regulator [Phycisphaera sp.]|nr:MAG: helix-turn-helix transcriptional regulator [Phycisphaera sp.]